jgi:hypothetical protein
MDDDTDSGSNSETVTEYHSDSESSTVSTILDPGAEVSSGNSRPRSPTGVRTRSMTLRQNVTGVQTRAMTKRTKNIQPSLPLPTPGHREAQGLRGFLSPPKKRARASVVAV